MNDNNIQLSISVPFANEREAEVAYESLRVDKEPPRCRVAKSLSLYNNMLNISFSASSAQQLRVAVSSFFDHLTLSVELIDKFGPPISSKYSYT